MFKKTFTIVALICLFSIKTQAQDVLWASEVIEFSSELSNVEYSAKQALGKPNVYPLGGENPNAWLPKKPDKIDFLKVGFEKPIKVQQIAIAESMNPSAIKEVFLYDKSGKEYEVYSFDPAPINLSRRMLNIFIDPTEYEAYALKLVLDGSRVEGYNSIDAIGISNSKTPIKIEIHLPSDLNENEESVKLDTAVNSKYNEIKPLISPDGNTLYFSRQNHPDNIGGVDDVEDIWYSERDMNTGQWLPAKNVGAPLNTAGPNFISSITPDGNTMIVLLGNKYDKNGKMSAGVSISTKTSEGWESPTTLNIKNDYNMSPKVDYYLANNRKVLIMSVQRTDGHGDRDLFVSFIKDDGTWEEPKNLGTDVNTASEESAPFLAPDDKTLYFSSRGYSGYGNTDIYVTRRLDDTWQNWSEPENMGPGVNSKDDDIFFYTDPKGEYSYYAKSIEGGDADIYAINMPELFKPTPIILVRGKVFDRETQKPISARIFYEQLPEGTEIGTINSDPVTGEYQIMLPAGVKYGYLAEAEGYIAINENIDLESTTEYAEIDQNLILVPIKKGETIRLNNIFFAFDKSTLKEDSYPELNRVVELLLKNANVNIEIVGHTDNIGSAKYNKTLSERRAKSVFTYLVDKGIDGARLTSVGYGKDKPLVSNDQEREGREINRRVEFKILEN